MLIVLQGSSWCPITSGCRGLRPRHTLLVGETVLDGYGSRPFAAFGSSFTASPGGAGRTRPSSWPCCWAARHRGRWVFLGPSSAPWPPSPFDFALALGYGLREHACRRPWFPGLARCYVAGVRPQTPGRWPRRWEGPLEQESQGRPREACRERAETAPDRIGQLGQLIRESFVAGVFLGRAGDRTQFATIALATRTAFSFRRPAGRHPGRPWLGDGAGGGRRQVDRPADFRAAALSPQRWACFSARPLICHPAGPGFDFGSARGFSGS